MATAETKFDIRAARFAAALMFPYFQNALWSLIPVPVANPPEDLKGTMAVDKYWRCYYDAGAEWTYEQGSALLVHEIGHLLRDHHDRALHLPGVTPKSFNLAGDAEINDDLHECDQLRNKWPFQIVIPSNLPQAIGNPRVQAPPDFETLEFYHTWINKNAPPPKPCTCGKQGKGQPQQKPGQGQPQDAGDQDGSGQGGGEQGAGQQQQGGSGQGQQQGQQPQNGSGQGQGGQQNQPGQGGGGGQGQPDPNCPVHGSGSGQGQAKGAPKPQNCGSGANGQAQPWDLGEPDHQNPGVSEVHSDLLRRKVAHDIEEYESGPKSRGDVPAGWRRWADLTLRPQIDWRKQFPQLVNYAVALASGHVDYSFQRPNKRSTAYGFIVPKLIRPIIKVGFVQDTSGSMDDEDVAAGLGEMGGVLKHYPDLMVFSVDACAHTAQRITNVKQVQLFGGGGTDMRIGIDAAIKARCNVIVVATDGWTPWPATRPKVPVVAAIINQPQMEVPEWLKRSTVYVNTKRERNAA